MQDKLDDKIDKLTSMMSKLTAQSHKQDKQFKPKIYEGKRENRQSITVTRVVTGPEIDLLVVIRECHLEAEVEVNIYKIMDRTIDRIIEEDCKTIIEITLGKEIIGRCKIIGISRITEVDVETITVTVIEMTIETVTETIKDDYRNDNFGRGRSRSRKTHNSHNVRRDDRSSSRSGSRSRSSSRASNNRDRIRCYKCREYDHFADNHPNTDMDEETDQLQQLYDSDENQAALQFLVSDSYKDFIRARSGKAIDYFNLQEVRMAPPHLCL